MRVNTHVDIGPVVRQITAFLTAAYHDALGREVAAGTLTPDTATRVLLAAREIASDPTFYDRVEARQREHNPDWPLAPDADDRNDPLVRRLSEAPGDEGDAVD